MIFKELLGLFVLFSCVCYIFECSVVTTKRLSQTVKTRYGQMRGALVEFPGTNMKPVSAFLSLEYGTAMSNQPVRFMPPQSPAERWIDSIRVMFRHRAVCPQKLINEEELLKEKPIGEVERLKRLSSFTMSQYEECMRLNVYVPTDCSLQEASTERRKVPTQMPRTQGSNLELDNTVSDLWKHALSAGTRTLYDTGYEHFQRYMLLSGCKWTPDTMPPISEDILVYFVAHCFKNLNLSYTTIKLYLAGIRFSYLRANVSSPLDNLHTNPQPRLALILKAVKRVQCNKPRPRLPITKDVLYDITSALRKGVFFSASDLVMECVCVIAFFGFLRCGEFTVRSKEHFDPSRHLCCEDVTFYEKHLSLHLKESKTDPFRKGLHIQLHCTNSFLCPFTIMQKYIAKRKESGTFRTRNPLFITCDGRPLDRQTFIGNLKHILSVCGYNSNNYNGHSFRIGAATTAGQKGIEDHMIKTLGRWSSESYCRYIRTSNGSIREAQMVLSA